MAVIHMQSEQVQEMVRQVARSAERLDELLQQARAQSSRLSTAWHGGRNASAYQSDLAACLARLKQLVQALDALHQRGLHEVDQWLQMDADGVRSFRSASNRLPGYTSTGTIAGIAAGGSLAAFDWGAWWRKGGEESLKIFADMPYDSAVRTSYQGIGRFLNFMEGSTRAGWVRRMDKIGHLIRGPLKKALPVIGYGFGVWGDLSEGKDLGTALGSELVDTALNLIPVVAAYNLGLAVVELGAGGAELLGMPGAGQLQQDLKKFDFTEKLGDAVYNFCRDHPYEALKTVLLPGGMGKMFSPEYTRFGGQFFADNLRDFGWESGALWVENQTEQSARIFEYMDITHPKRYVERWSSAFSPLLK